MTGPPTYKEAWLFPSARLIVEDQIRVYLDAQTGTLWQVDVTVFNDWVIAHDREAVCVCADRWVVK